MEKHRCRSCDAEHEKQFVRGKHVFESKGRHKFWQCKECGLVYLWPIPSQKEKDRFYAQEFENFYWSIAYHYYFFPESLSYIPDQLDCHYEFVPEHRYDLSNHLVWMQKSKPGGQGRHSAIFSKKTLEIYSKDLKEK